MTKSATDYQMQPESCSEGLDGRGGQRPCQKEVRSVPGANTGGSFPPPVAPAPELLGGGVILDRGS